MTGQAPKAEGICPECSGPLEHGTCRFCARFEAILGDAPDGASPIGEHFDGAPQDGIGEVVLGE